MINPDTFLLAEISENIKLLQLQLDYEKSRLTTALGGDPVLYDVAGIGAIIGGSGKFGAGSAIAGAAVQVDGGDMVIGDGAGAAMITAGQNGIHQAKKYKTTNYSIADDTAISFTPAGTITGLIVLIGNYAPTSGLIHFRTTSSVFCAGLLLGSGTNVTTGALTGTTGTDGKMTVSAHTDGKVYIENRQGATTSISVLIMGY